MNNKKKYYTTIEEASKAATTLGVQTAKEYQKKYSQDLRLP